MSETLTSQEVKALEEMPTALEMGELRKITTLQDIPLAEGISMQQLKTSHPEAKEENDRKLKTNSLKRFLRLPSRKKFGGDGSLETERSEINFDEANMPNVLHSPKRLTGSLSKATLKSSWSTYWNSMFKPKKTRKSAQSQDEFDPNPLQTSSSVNMESRLPAADIELQDNVSNLVEKSIFEGIQSLKISQECAPK